MDSTRPKLSPIGILKQPPGIERHNSQQSLNTDENFIDDSLKNDIILPNQTSEIEHIAIDIVVLLTGRFINQNMLVHKARIGRQIEFQEI